MQTPFEHAIETGLWWIAGTLLLLVTIWALIDIDNGPDVRQ